ALVNSIGPPRSLSIRTVISTSPTGATIGCRCSTLVATTSPPSWGRAPCPSGASPSWTPTTICGTSGREPGGWREESISSIPHGWILIRRAGYWCWSPTARASRCIPSTGRSNALVSRRSRDHRPPGCSSLVACGGRLEREQTWDTTMTMKVGRIPYLEYEPLYFDMARRCIAMYAMVPSQLAAAAAAGAIDAGPVPLVDCFRLEDRLQPVSGFCLACAKRAGNIFLYAKQPIEQLTGARIGITDETSTALRLLQVLLSLKYHVQPAAYVTLQDPYDAFLLIGNRALRQRGGARGYPYTYDLGEEWYRWTGLPFVYARWIARQDLAPADIAELEDALYVGLDD